MCQHHIPFNQKAAKKEDLEAHHEEHQLWSRRSFTKALGLTGAGSILLANTRLSAAKASPLSAAISNSENENILIILRLKGGNDGLNTIVPVNQYDTYANYRPSLRIPENNLLNLSDEFALPNYMSNLQSLWGSGQMKVINGVGYDNPNLSHFKGSANWATTDSPNTGVSTGWMGRHFEEMYPDFLFNPPAIPAAIQIGNNGNVIFDGEDANYAFAVANPQQLYQIAQNGTMYSLENQPDCTFGSQSSFVRGVANNTLAYAGVINTAFESSAEGVNYTDGRLSKQLNIVSRLIKGNLGTKVYMVSLGGFDTHNNQANKHQELMTEIADSMKAFYEDLENAGFNNKVLTMTISEFGRRPKQNGSNGTDHGTASPLMLFGGGLNGNGFAGEYPDLLDLDNNDNLKHSVDFRQIYATVLSEWLCLDATMVNQILLGQEFNTLSLGLNCSGTLSNENTPTSSQFDNAFVYNGETPTIRYQNKRASHIVVKLYNLLGQEIATLQNEFVLEGIHEIPIEQGSFDNGLTTGQYIYRISTSTGNYSKSFILK